MIDNLNGVTMMDGSDITGKARGSVYLINATFWNQAVVYDIAGVYVGRNDKIAYMNVQWLGANTDGLPDAFTCRVSYDTSMWFCETWGFLMHVKSISWHWFFHIMHLFLLLNLQHIGFFDMHLLP